MSILVEGQGMAWSGGNISNIKSAEIPNAWSKEMIDVTLLVNQRVKTKKGATLKEYEAVTVTCAYDPAIAADVETPATSSLDDSNQAHTLTFPDSAGTVVFWGEISSVGKASAETDGEMTYDVEVTPTNRNAADVETPPVFAVGS